MRSRSLTARCESNAWTPGARWCSLEQSRLAWAFELRRTDGHTRLSSHNSFCPSKLRLRDWLACPIIEPGSWVMQRKMLLTIKQRAGTLNRTSGRDGHGGN